MGVGLQPVGSPGVLQDHLVYTAPAFGNQPSPRPAAGEMFPDTQAPPASVFQEHCKHQLSPEASLPSRGPPRSHPSSPGQLLGGTRLLPPFFVINKPQLEARQHLLFWL